MAIGETIRKAIDRSGQTLYRVAKDAELNYSTVHRFYHGERSIRLESLELLAESLGLELKPRAKKGRA